MIWDHSLAEFNSELDDPDKLPKAVDEMLRMFSVISFTRRELRIALESFLNRFDNIHIPEGAEYKYHAGSTFNVDSLPIAWTRKTA